MSPYVVSTSIGADSTGATGNFAPVLTQEPGKTLRFAPVPFMTALIFYGVGSIQLLLFSNHIYRIAVFGKINSLLLINPHAITYAMVEVFCPYRLG